MGGKKHSDLFLPNQDFARYLYRDAQPYDEALYALVSDHARQFRANGLKLAMSEKVGFEEIGGPRYHAGSLQGLRRHRAPQLRRERLRRAHYLDRRGRRGVARQAA
jgi:hypothetical protein